MSDNQDQEMSNDTDVNYLEMADEDVSLYPPTQSSEAPAEEETSEPEEDYSEDTPEEDDQSGSDDYEEDSEEHFDGDDQDHDDTDEESQDTAEDLSDEEDPSTSAEVDYKTAYERVTAPFKANGKTIQANNVDDAIRLMQKGANYVKKMEQIKPHLKLVKMLGNSNLLDEQKLNRLIDMSNGDKAALKQFLAEQEIEATDLDTRYDEEEDTPYVPKDHSVSDKEFEMSTVLDDIRSTPSYRTLINVVTQEWGEDSRTAINDRPEVLYTLNEHIGNGLYDQIKDQIDNLKTFDNYPKGVPEIEVYGRIFGQMQQSGTINQPSDEPSEQSQNITRNRNEESRKAKRKAATSTRRTTKSSSPKIENILDMDDEQFLNQSDTSLFRIV